MFLGLESRFKEFVLFADGLTEDVELENDVSVVRLDD